jgi:hypothetical protein
MHRHLQQLTKMSFSAPMGTKGRAQMLLTAAAMALSLSVTTAYACGCDDDETDNACLTSEAFDIATGKCILLPAS